MARRMPASAQRGNGLNFITYAETLQAPTGGWNARDSLAAMESKYAVVMENWFPRSSSVVLRSGSTTQNSGAPKPVETLIPYNTVTTPRLFAATGSGIYDVSSPGTFGTAVTSITSGWCKYANSNVVDVSYLHVVNGVDNLKLYNGTTWYTVTETSATFAITGVDTNTLSDIAWHNQRLWFMQRASMNLYYLDAQTVSGAVQSFDVGPLFTRGGSLAGICTWTVDGGAGPSDNFVIFTTEGEVAVYSGTDPSNASTWHLIGVFFIGQPISGKFFHQFGGDIAVLTVGGVVPLSLFMQSASINRQAALTYTIQDAIATAVAAYKNLTGWQLIVYPAGPFALINIPQASGQATQYVMNTITGAWCSFTGWNANCFAEFNGALYFGTNSTVVEAWVGASDDGAVIVASCMPAYNYLGSSGRTKLIKQLQPIITSDNPVTVQLGIGVDFQLSTSYTTLIVPPIPGAEWDSGIWDTAIWGGLAETTLQWATVAAYPSIAVSCAMRVSTNLTQVTWSATRVNYQLGAYL